MPLITLLLLVVLDAASKTITLTYTKFVENNSGVRGKFFVYVRVDHDVVSEEKTLMLTLQ